MILTIEPMLPCAVLKDGQACGTPAAVVEAVPMDDGRYVVLPMCADCAAALMALYFQNLPTEHEQ